MKILFVYPGIASIGYNSAARCLKSFDPAGFAVPMGIMCLAAAAENAGFETDILDLRYVTDIDEVEKKIIESSAEIIGISVQTPSFTFAVDVARVAKKNGIKVVAGGIHATVSPEDFKQANCFDHIITREGEISLIELLKDLEKGKKREFLIQGKVVLNIDHYNDLKDFSLYKKSFALGHAVEFSRGCSAKCSYCVSGVGILYEPKLKHRSVDGLLEGVKTFKSKYDFKTLHFADVNATAFKSDFINFCERVTSLYPDISVEVSSRVDCFDDDIAKSLSLFPNAVVWFGFETISKKLAKFLRKSVNLSDNFKAVELCKKYKIELGANVLTGVPTETDSDIESTYEFIKKIRPSRINYNVLSPFPGTQIAQYCKKHGLLESPLPPTHYEMGWVLNNGLIKGVNYERARTWMPHFISCAKNYNPLDIGLLFEKSNNLSGALKEYYLAVQKNENPIVSNYYLASLLKRQGKEIEAMAYFNRLLEYQSDKISHHIYFGNGFFHRGEIFYRKGEMSKAAKDFNQCLNIIPTHKSCREYLSKIKGAPSGIPHFI